LKEAFSTTLSPEEEEEEENKRVEKLTFRM
jgi:hypothetical protein